MRQKKFELAVSLSDLHIPVHDPIAVQLALEFIEDKQPQVVFINGDLLELYDVSRWPDIDPNSIDLRTELDMGKSFLNDLRKTAPKARIVYVYGNHEHRLLIYMLKFGPKLLGLSGMTLEDQLDLKSFKIEKVYSNSIENCVQYGELLVGHWMKALKNPGATALALMQKFGMSVLQAHGHKVATVTKRTYQGYIGGYEQGCLCTLNPHWEFQPNWMQGFAVIHRSTEGHYFHVEPIKMINHKFFYGGEKWEA